MELNSDIFTAITRFLDTKDMASFATSSSQTTAFLTNTISQDPKLLSIYLNNVIKNCSTKEEVAEHLERFGAGDGTPCNLTCTHTEVGKLIPIKKKFQNLRRFSYIRPEELSSISCARRIAFYVFNALFFIAISPVLVPLIVYQIIHYHLGYNMGDFPNCIKKPFEKIGVLYERVCAAITKDTSLELAASLYPRMEELNIRLISARINGFELCTLPFLQNLQHLSIVPITAEDINTHMRTTGHLFDQYSNLKTLEVSVSMYENFAIMDNTKFFPKQLKEISLRFCDIKMMTYLLSACDNLESLSYTWGNNFSEEPLSCPYEPLKQFKHSTRIINMQNLFFSFPNLEELEIANICVPNIPYSEKVKKISTDECTGLASLLANCPNLENVIVTKRENEFEVPPQFKEIGRGTTADNRHYISLKPIR
jgi:hypothetical protein